MPPYSSRHLQHISAELENDVLRESMQPETSSTVRATSMDDLPSELLYHVLGLFVCNSLCRILLDPDVDESEDRAIRPLLLVSRRFRQLTLDLLRYTLGEPPDSGGTRYVVCPFITF